MPERSSSSWRGWFSHKSRRTTGQGKLKGQDYPDVQNSGVDVSQPATHREPISFPLQAPAATSTSSSPLPAAQASNSGDAATSAEAHCTASPPERLWDRAYDDLKAAETTLLHTYEKILSCNLHGDGFGSAVTESQPNAIVQYDPDRRRRQMEQLVHMGLDKTAREAKVKEGLGPTMDIVLSAKNTVSFAIQAMPQAALAWTGVCIALEMLVNPIKETETNRDGVVYVIKWMNWYWSLSSSLLKESTDDANELSEVRRELENQIVDLYKVLLTYQIKSVCSYYRHRGLVFLRDIVMLDDWDGDLRAILDAEKRFRQYSKAYTTQQTNSHLEQLVTNRRSEKDQQCLSDLRSTDPRDDKTRIEQTKGGLLRDSYRWILDNPKLQQWCDDPEHTLLWIRADPGKGKTMLLCGIVDELEKLTPPGLLSFFFCQGTDSRINNATAVLRGLIYLLTDQQPSLVSHLRKKYDYAGKSLFEDANSWVALSDIFKNILQDTNLKTTYLVIDALDECVTDLPKLLDFIIDTSSSSAPVKWLLSSRNELHIEQKLRSAQERTSLSLELKENAEQVSQAVDVYISDKLSRVESLQDDGLRDRVRDILSRKANGTFLWVALVVQELERPQSWDPLQVVEEVPTDLHQLYDRMVNQIQQLTKRNSELCWLILSIATVAYRPLHLAEIGSICGLPGQIPALTKNVRKIVAMCGSFLTVQDDQVYFIHQSAKDYLSDEARATIFPSQRKTHHYIFLRSLELMSSVLQRDMYSLIAPGFPIDQVQVPDQDPLETTRYSCVHWVDHLCDSVSGNNTRRDDDLQDGDVTYIFLKSQYLYWLEALSLCKSMSEGVVSMAKLETLVQGRANASALIELVRDARRFIMYHKWAIENSPLQVYASALVFSPARSLIRCLFKKEEPKWITIRPAMEDKWSACLQTLEGHSGYVSDVAFSPDGKQLASADNTVKLWDASTGAALLTLEGHSGHVCAVAFSPDGKQLASASFDKTVKLWDAGTGIALQTLDAHSEVVRAIAFSPDGKQLASASDDKMVKVWDAGTGAALQTIEHSNRVSSVAFSPDGKQLASASADKTVKLWDAGAEVMPQRLEGHRDRVNAVTFSPDGKQLASASSDKTVKLWDTDTGIALQTLNAHSGSVWTVAFSPDGKQLASASADKTVKLWDLGTGVAPRTLGVHSDLVRAVAFSPDGKQLVSVSDDETVKLWDAGIGAALQTLKGHSKEVRAVAFSSDGKQLASASADKTVKLWDTGTGVALQTLEGHQGWVNAVAFSPDGKQLASASYDKTVKLWDTGTGATLQTLKAHANWVSAVTFSPDGKQLASASPEETVKLWDTGTGIALQTLEIHSSLVSAVAFSPDGKQLASASYDNTVKLWDAGTGAALRTLEDHSSYVLAVAFSPDGKQLASASYDKTVKLWDAGTGIVLQTLMVNIVITTLSFSDDGTSLNTDWGSLPITHPSPSIVPSRQGLFRGISVQKEWITWETKNMLWLPFEHRPQCVAVDGNIVALGSRSGLVSIMEFAL